MEELSRFLVHKIPNWPYSMVRVFCIVIHNKKQKDDPGAGSEVEKPGNESGPIWHAEAASRGLACYAMAPTPHKVLEEEYARYMQKLDQEHNL